MDQVEFDYEEGRIDRSSAELEPNPFDLNALEVAVQFSEQVPAEIFAVSMGPEQAESTLREALARGADQAVLLCDKAFAGSDTWATSSVLGAAIREIGEYDLIVCGEKTVDGDTGQVGPEVAEDLSIPHVTYVSEVESVKTDHLDIVSESWDQMHTKRVHFPALITVTKDVNEPRLPSFKDKMAAKKADIDTWRAEDLTTLDPDSCGIQGSPTYVADMEVPPPDKRKGNVFRDDPPQAVKKLLSELELGGISHE